MAATQVYEIDYAGDLNHSSTLVNNPIDLPILPFRARQPRQRTMRRLADIDNKWESHPMGNKAPETTRMVFQNINSLQPKNNIKWVDIIRTIIENKNDMLGLVETSVNWSLRKLKSRHRKDLLYMKHERPCNPLHLLPLPSRRTRQSVLKNYLPGGTASVTLGNWTGVLQEHLYDAQTMGRWSGQQFRINAETRLF